MTSMLHALSSTFTTCACGARARDCALNRLAEFVHAGTPPTPSPSPPSSFSFSHHNNPNSQNSQNHEAYGEENGHAQDRKEGKEGKRGKTSLGPLIGAKRGFRTRERVPGSGGMSGVEMDVDVDSTGALSLGKVKWAGEAGPSSSRSLNGNGVSGVSGVSGMSGSGMERSVSGSTEGSVVSHSHSSRKGKGRASVGEEEQDVEMDSGRRTGGALSLSSPRRRYLTFT